MPPSCRARRRSQPDAPRVWEDAPDNICFVHEVGDRAAVEAAMARADRIVRRRFVINRVTAAAMEPRGAIGDYNPADGRYTIYTTLQRTHAYRADLAQIIGVPESRIRVVAGDIGGSFGMKSAIYNEVALVLLASKLLGRPVKWTSTRSEAFLSDAQARDHVTEAELALDRDGNFLAFRTRTIAATGAYAQQNSNVFVMNLGTLAGVYRTPAMHAEVTAVFTNTNPVRPYRGNGRPEFAYVIERMVDEAAAETRHRPGRIAPPQHDPARGDAVQDRADLHLRLRRVRQEHGHGARSSPISPGSRRAAPSRAPAAGCAASASRTRSSAPRRAGSRRPRSASTAAAPRRCCRGSITQGMGHETVFKQLMCDRLGLHPDQVTYIQGDTDKVALGEGTGGSRSATLGGSAVLMATDRIVEKAKAIAAHLLEAAEADIDFADGVFSIAGTDRTVPLRRIAAEAWDPKSLPDGMEPGLVASAAYAAGEQNFPNGVHVCELEIDPETGEVEILRYNVVDDVGTVMNPLLLEGQIRGGIAQGVGQLLMRGHPFRPRNRPARDRLVHGLRDAARRRHPDDALRDQPGADPDQPARRQGRGRGRRGRRDAGGRQRADRRAETARHPRPADAGDAGAHLARDPRGAERAGGAHRRIFLPARDACSGMLVAAQYGRERDADRGSLAARRQSGDAGTDPAARAACRGYRAQRCLGQRAHHRAARAISALAACSTTRS